MRPRAFIADHPRRRLRQHGGRRSTAPRTYLARGGTSREVTGLQAGDRLPPSTEEDPLLLSAEEQETRGIRQLPASLPAAADELAGSSVLRGAMGDFLFEVFLATRRGEAEQYEGFDDDRLIRALRWRY